MSFDLPKLAAALGLVMVLGTAAAFAQAPPPVPALPDAERRTSYSISGTTCACSINFQLYQDSSDIDQFIQVYLNGTRVLSTDSSAGWAITSATGSLGSIPRPITNGVLTFNSVQTGTVQIVGAQRPRRLTEVAENRGVAARDFNQFANGVEAQLRESWDLRNRTLLGPPGQTYGSLPAAASCLSAIVGFDATGLQPVCETALQLGVLIVPNTTTVGHLATWGDTVGHTLLDTNNVLGAVSLTGGPLTINPTGGNIGINMQFFDANAGILVTNVPSGAPGSYGTPVGIGSTLRYTVTGDSADNPTGLYGVLSYESGHNFTGVGAALRGNAYTAPALTAVPAAGGSNNQVGDILTVTCTVLGSLNSAPTFSVIAVSGGAVTLVVPSNHGGCLTYPANPAATTSSRGGATPPTLTLTNTAINVTNLIGVSGRARHVASGTVANSVAFFADGCYAAAGGGGSTTVCSGLFIQPPYDTPAASYGVWFNGAFSTASIGVAAGSNLSIQLPAGNFMAVGGGWIQVTGNLTNQFIASGGTNTRSAFAAGRAVNEGFFGVAGVANDFFTGTAGGDTVLGANSNLWLAVNLAGSGIGAINISNSNLVTVFSPLAINAGAVVGAPTGGNKGSGTINVAGDYYKNNAIIGETATAPITLSGAGAIGCATCVTSAASLTANQLVIGSGSQGEQSLGTLGTTTTVLHGNAAGAPTFAAVVSADLNITTTTCTNQFVTAISAGAVGTCTTDTLAGAQHANQGTTTTVLHGNAAGNPSWAAVSLTADVSGILPGANGGTGVANTGLTLTLAGSLSLPVVAQGDLWYGSAANTISALAKNTTATRYLSNTGTSNNPAWAQVDLTNGVTGTLPVGNGGTGTATAFTQGSVIFAGASGVYTQNNTKLFWDNSAFTLAVNAASATDTLEVGGAIRPVTAVAFDATRPGRIYKGSVTGLSFQGVTGSTNDLSFYTPNGTALIEIPTGTALVAMRSGPVAIGTVSVTATTGELGFAKITASGTAPGAGAVKISAVAGTNVGTCKIIIYAGTSTTPVTIVDNVGAGC